MARMPVDEARAFLSAGARTGKLATVREDGSPHVAPIWFVLDSEGDIVFTTGEDTVKGKAIRRDPRISMLVEDETPPFSFVRVDGEATTSEDLDDMLVWATRIAARYMGDDKADAYGKRNAVKGELLVRLRPTKIVGQKNIAD
jgi:PPOX class probable F420-dependent enzyme